MKKQKETFTNQFDISFNPANFGDGFFSKKRARITVVLDNIFSVQDAKKLLEEQGIFPESISRLT